MGGSIAIGRAASLSVMLPRESRITEKIDSQAAWSDANYLLSSIEYSLRVLVWAKTKDAQHGRNKPKPPFVPKSDITHSYTKSDMSEVAEAFGIKYD